jgi:DNA polymerase-1
MTYVILDSENTTFSKGDSKDLRNKNVIWSYTTYKNWGTTDNLEFLQDLIDESEIIVGFHLAYDLEWLWRLGIDTEGKKFFCCQVAEFILNNQTTPYPSLNQVADKYLQKQKLDVVKTEYWDKGINTDQIPSEILAEYALEDALLTKAVYLKQLELIPAEQKNLISLAMQDMLVLAEMRHNGMKYSKDYANQQQQQLLEQIRGIQSQLDLLHNVPSFNWSSSAHLSALLFGGIIQEEVKVPIGFFKTGKRAGEQKYGKEIKEYHLPRMYKPVKKTPDGKWSTDEDSLIKLNDGSNLISGILKIRELSKLVGTYFQGIPELAEKSCWKEGYLYGQFNQCVAATGRLSSSKPNMQNMPEAAQKMIISRWED